jgi:hypothetical protein
MTKSKKPKLSMDRVTKMADTIVETALAQDCNPPELMKACVTVLGYLIANCMPETDIDSVVRTVGRMIEDERDWHGENPPALLH